MTLKKWIEIVLEFLNTLNESSEYNEDTLQQILEKHKDITERLSRKKELKNKSLAKRRAVKAIEKDYYTVLKKKNKDRAVFLINEAAKLLEDE